MAFPPIPSVRAALLKVLAELGGSARPGDAVPLVTAAFPELTAEDLGMLLADGKTNKWKNRVNWTRQHLVDAGVVDSSQRGVWKLTPEGERVAATNPTHIAVRSRGASRKSSSGDKQVSDEPFEVEAEPVPQAVAEAPSQLESLIATLREAAADSQAPDRFELAIADAFRALGFEAERIGGAGRTDVLLSASLGVERYRVVVDAKSTGRAKVSDAQVDWLSIRGHRDQERADHAAIVGSLFAGGNLLLRAREFDVALLTVEDLIEVLALHAQAPLTLVELRTLFDPSTDSAVKLERVRAASKQRARRLLLPMHLLRFIENFNLHQPGLVLARAETLLALAITVPDLRGTTLDDVRRGLALLETAGVLESREGDGYVSQTTLTGGEAFLRAIGRSFH